MRSGCKQGVKDVAEQQREEMQRQSPSAGALETENEGVWVLTDVALSVEAAKPERACCCCCCVVMLRAFL